MKVAIVGCGKLGSALARALVNKHEVLAIRRDVSKIDVECEKSSKIEDAKGCDVVILTLKPDVFRSLSEVRFDGIVVSFMAGVSLKELGRCGERVARAMTSLSAEFGSSFVTYCCRNLSDKDREKLLDVLSCFGRVMEVDERVVDASTAFSSSVAFIARLIGAASLAGVRLGIDSNTSRTLALLAFSDAVKLVERDGVEKVVERVCTPAGSTIEGMAKMMECGAEWCLQEAIYAAGRKFME